MVITKEKAKKLIYKVLSSMPIDVFDEDDGTVWETGNYELFNPRPEGDYEGSREIGAANIVSAFNLLHQKMILDHRNFVWQFDWPIHLLASHTLSPCLTQLSYQRSHQILKLLIGCRVEEDSCLENLLQYMNRFD